jgi:hypothetical protein
LVALFKAHKERGSGENIKFVERIIVWLASCNTSFSSVPVLARVKF